MTKESVSKQGWMLGIVAFVVSFFIVFFIMTTAHNYNPCEKGQHLINQGTDTETCV